MKKCIGIIVTLFLIVMLTGCNLSTINYKDYDKYVTNYTTLKLSEVTSIQVNWVFGDVNIKSGNSIDIVEEVEMDNGEAVNDDYKARYYLNDGKLIIQFMKSGLRVQEKDFKTKNLSLTIPYNIDVTIKAVAANVSGVLSSFKNVDITSVSGNVMLSEFDAETIVINTTSGDIGANMCDFKDVKAKSVSGQIYLQYFTPNKVEVKTTSGDISINSLTKCGFNLGYKTVSGDFNSELDLVYNGRRYVYGNGNCDIDLTSTSGNISIR